MKTRKLGKSNLEVSAIGFGCMGLNFGVDFVKAALVAGHAVVATISGSITPSIDNPWKVFHAA
jgi:predicted aldo/keto reductase-like oxidoreductase